MRWELSSGGDGGKEEGVESLCRGPLKEFGESPGKSNGEGPSHAGRWARPRSSALTPGFSGRVTGAHVSVYKTCARDVCL